MTTKQVWLSGGTEFYAIVDEEDYENVMQYNWHLCKGTKTNYAKRNMKRLDGTFTKEGLHTFLTGYKRTDHVDHNGLNCSKSNLREVTSSQNQMNREPNKNGASRFKGLDWRPESKKWRVRIWVDGVRYYLGMFDDEIEAADVYDTSAKKYHKEFALLNFPTSAA